MKTAVRRVLLMSALMSPGALYALGLGEIRLNSALNQPFDADIELVSATQEDLGALRAALASSDAFTRYGLDRPAYLSDFSFRVVKGADGRDVLKVTSPRPVTEPFVTLLVEANWPRGRLLREYTVLLDPPVYAPETVVAAAPAVAAPRVSSGGATSVRPTESTVDNPPEAAPAPVRQPRAERVADAPAAPALEPGSAYRVRRNDTLWSIASAANPGTRSDVNRAMVAIFQKNPQAFDGNINVLRSGSTLSIPSSGEIQAISASAASAEVARQYEAWRNGTRTAAETGDAGRLRLVTPEQGTAAPSTAATTPPAPLQPAATAAPSPTASNAAPAGATDLETRVQQLETELAEARRLLEVRNAELATLQGGTAVPVDGSTPAADAAATPDTAPAEPATAPAAATEPRTPEPAEAAGPTLLERVAEYWWALLALLAAVLGIGLYRRMRREHGDAEENLEAALRTKDLRASPTSYAPRSRDSDIVVEEKRAVEPVRTAATAAAGVVTAPAPAARAPEPTRKPVSIEDTLSGEGPANIESGDPLAEADFHMAYGLYDQAADLVQLAIKREPQRRDLKLKLLEIFFVWGNRDRFLETARELETTRAGAPAGEWDKVLIMGKQIAPEDAMFAGAASATDSLDMELHAATGSIDLDLSGMPGTAPDVDLTEESTSRADASGIDFILDEPVRGNDDTAVAPTVETPRVRRDTGDTEELAVDSLGLEVDSLRALEALEGDSETTATGRDRVEDTVETTAVAARGRNLLEEEADLLQSTALMRTSEDTSQLPVVDGGDDAVIDLSEATGEVLLTDSRILTPRVDYDLGGEPATMSEVGTKLDLARAYMDMGDPEGARSILEEVVQEGNSAQRQEAERLIASLP